MRGRIESEAPFSRVMNTQVPTSGYRGKNEVCLCVYESERVSLFYGLLYGSLNTPPSHHSKYYLEAKECNSYNNNCYKTEPEIICVSNCVGMFDNFEGF